MKGLSDRGRILSLLAAMAGVAVLTAAMSLWLLYHTALDEGRSRLVETAQSQARLIEAIARFNAVYSPTDFSGSAAVATLSQITDAHQRYQGFGETGEFTLARREADQIVFLVSHRHYDLDTPNPVPWESDIAEPIRLALSGQSGTVVGPDYRDVLVLAAYEPVTELGFGIVAKIDMAEVRRPFLRAAGLSGLGALLIVVLGIVVSRRISTPMVERLKAEKVLKESEAQLRLVVDNLPVLIVYIDADQRFRLVNRTCAAWYGMPAAEILGKRVAEIHGDRYALFKPHIDAVLSGESVTFETEAAYPSGERRNIRSVHVPHVDPQGTVRGYFSLTQDITESKRAEKEIRTLNADLERRVLERTEELRRSEMRLRDAVEALPAGFALYDREDHLVLCNQGYRQQVFHDRESIPYGETFEVILKDKLSRGHYPDAEGREAEWLAERLRAHREASGPIEQMHSNGYWYWINEHRISEGSTVVVSADITERKRLESDLLRQERLATLGRLTATVSHELRNPLGVISTSTYLLHKVLPDHDSRATRALERIDRNVLRCDRIIDEMLDFTHIPKLELEPTPIDTWLQEVVTDQTLPSEVTLRWALGLPNSPVSVDRDRFRRVVINVFDNACQAMTGEGTTYTGSKECTLTVRTQERNGHVEVIFEDTGPGIPCEINERIFEPLFSTKSFGIGLGMPMVKRIMEQHGGSIEIESEDGRGARVRLCLPTSHPLH